MQGKGLGSALPEKLREKINDPINFKPLTQDLAHGYEADVLIEVAKAIIAADQADAIQPPDAWDDLIVSYWRGQPWARSNGG